MPRPAPRIPRELPQHNRKPNDRLKPKHYDWIKTLPCAVCGRAGPSDPAHVRMGTDGGTGLKPNDRFTLPLCRAHHDQQHRIGELTYWGDLGVDPVDLTNRLYRVSGDTEQGLRALARFRQAIALKGAK